MKLHSCLRKFPGRRREAHASRHGPAMTQNTAKLVFWGVRGSTPTLERDTWRYGGNTPCLELTAPDGTHFILDCGTGLRMLGNHLHAAQSLDAMAGRRRNRSARPGDALSLGPHSGHSVFPSVLRIAESLSFLQLSIEVSGPQQPAPGARSATREPVFSGGREHDGRRRAPFAKLPAAKNGKSTERTSRPHG